MKSLAVDKKSIKLLQLTDTHLFSDSDGCLLSVNTLDSFHAVIEEILAQSINFEAILATGDISQDHSVASYQRFEQGIIQLEKPCFWLPGNHDYKPSMQSVAPSQQIYSEPHVLLGEHWQLVLLDSQVEGVPYGRLTNEQLQLLSAKASENPHLHTLVLIHHHPVPVGSDWLDQHKLMDAEKLWNVIDQHSNIKAVVGGHVHQDFDRVINGVRILTTPSTCVQFKPDSKDFALEASSPGWRTLELFDNGELATQVYRLRNGRFFPDFSSGGY